MSISHSLNRSLEISEIRNGILKMHEIKSVFVTEIIKKMRFKSNFYFLIIICFSVQFPILSRHGPKIYQGTFLPLTHTHKK